MKKDKIIIIDADVASHFITGKEIYTLPAIFPYKIKMLDKVYAELEKPKSRKSILNNLIDQRVIEVIPFPDDDELIKREYFWIKNKMFKGDGESACLAFVRYKKDILASSNLKDIKHYCKMHSITYLTTMDFLCEALKQGVMNVERCNAFINRVIGAGSKLPVKRIEDFKCKDFKII